MNHLWFWNMSASLLWVFQSRPLAAFITGGIHIPIQWLLIRFHPLQHWAHFTVLQSRLSIPAALTDRLVWPTGLVSVCPTYYSNACCASFIDLVSVPCPLCFSYNKRPHENVWRRQAKLDQLSLIIIHSIISTNASQQMQHVFFSSHFSHSLKCFSGIALHSFVLLNEWSTEHETVLSMRLSKKHCVVYYYTT